MKPKQNQPVQSRMSPQVKPQNAPAPSKPGAGRGAQKPKSEPVDQAALKKYFFFVGQKANCSDKKGVGVLQELLISAYYQ
jgi:hypothetical protein